jgi:hypothetical protein
VQAWCRVKGIEKTHAPVGCDQSSFSEFTGDVRKWPVARLFNPF